MNPIFFRLFVVLWFFSFSCKQPTKFESLRATIDLGGKWHFAMDSSGIGEKEKWYLSDFSDSLVLPGTMDENKKGVPNKNHEETMRLSREKMYEGNAWYQKTVDIPESWRNREIVLWMERTKPSVIWVDSLYVGNNNDLLTPQKYRLTSQLKPGKHKITILINNGSNAVPQGVKGSHAWTEHTQTNWNGILGKICLESTADCYIKKITTFPDVAKKQVLVKVKIQNSGKSLPGGEIVLNASLINHAKSKVVPEKIVNAPISSGENIITIQYDLGENAELWSEFSPALYSLSVTLKNGNPIDNSLVTFGLRDFHAQGTQFVINGLTTFLRGKHDACVFPLTAHPPMDVESWRKVFRTARNYGINHYRFHSWTPPMAAFDAADLEGIYLQPELPFWGGFSKEKNLDLNAFLLKEGEHILNDYGNHPSFVMFSLGNELSGDHEVMIDLLKKLRSTDNRHLFGFGSNNYLGTKGYAEGEDYFTTCRVGEDKDTSFSTHSRASFSFADAAEGGFINGRYPNTTKTYSQAITKCLVPVIGHEIGQYQIYPDYREIKKYTGVLKPWNFEVFQKRLKEHGMDDQAGDFFKASGAASVICYREDIEMALRTPGFGGFHLLDLQDFPGQGTALIGILDAFMDSKGLITPEEFRHFCNQVVPLLEMKKYCWSKDEKFSANLKIANFSSSELKNQQIEWEIKDKQHVPYDNGTMEKTIGQGKLIPVSEINFPLNGIHSPEKLILTIRLKGTGYENSYPVWVYPATNMTDAGNDLDICRHLDQTMLKKLSNGEKVLFMPKLDEVKEQSVGGLFTPDYWNYRMFKGISESIKKPVSPGTMGLLIKSGNPLFQDFPTEFHTNWQWWAIVKNSRPLILDQLPSGYHPMVQVIDNVERNHKLGLICEFLVGKGKLLVCMSDLLTIQDKPEARQLLYSIKKYIKSDQFSPTFNLSENELKTLFQGSVKSRKIEGVHNISYD